MGTFLTVLLAVLIFGVGLRVFFKTIKREAVEGTCASCGHKGSCSSQESSCPTIKVVQFEDRKSNKKS